jgi:hypothetical protein
MRRLLMAERRRPGKGRRSLAALERDMRGLAKVVTFLALIASTHGARADEWDGCRSNEPDRVIASCTKVIKTPGIDPDHLGEALLRRGIGYDNLSQFQRAIGDDDEVIRILPVQRQIPRHRPQQSRRRLSQLWASRRKVCRTGRGLCSSFQVNLISGLCAAG